MNYLRGGLAISEIIVCFTLFSAWGINGYLYLMSYHIQVITHLIDIILGTFLLEPPLMSLHTW
jgi:hypothetical protein